MRREEEEAMDVSLCEHAKPVVASSSGDCSELLKPTLPDATLSAESVAMKETTVWTPPHHKAHWSPLIFPRGHLIPSERSGHASCVAPPDCTLPRVRNRMFVVGGWCGVRLIDVWELNFESHEWKLLSDVCPANVHEDPAAAQQHHNDNDNNDNDNDETPPHQSRSSWAYVVGGGTAPKRPLKRVGHTCVLWEQNIIIFGGRNNAWEKMNDVWQYDLETNTWTELRPAHPRSYDKIPAPRITHTAILFEDKMYICGGLDSSECSLSDLWEFNLKTRRWREIICTGDQITPRERHTAALDAQRRSMIVYGGFDERRDVYHDDVYSVNLDTLHCTKLLCTGKTMPTSGMRSHTAVVTVDGRYMIVFSGKNGGEGDHNDSFSLDLDTLTWTKLENNQYVPKKRGRHSALILPNGCMAVFGGNEGTGWLNDVSICSFGTFNRDIAQLWTD